MLSLYFQMTTTVRMFLTTILGFLWLGMVAGNRNGPPSGVCDSMTPGHGGSAMTTPAPYSISFSKNTYTANEQITGNVALHMSRHMRFPTMWYFDM